MTRQIELSAETIEYEDTGGEGSTIVMLAGLMADASLWEDVIADLCPNYRCIAPTLPLGAHRHAMHADADLSPRGLARLASESLERLEVCDVTLVGNDTGGALVQLIACEGPARVSRIMLVSCDAFDNFRLTGKTLVLTGKLPPAPPSSSGRAKTAGCRPSTANASPTFCREDGSSSCRTATRSSPSISPQGSLGAFGPSPTRQGV